ncbi:glycosyltransferase [Sabulilitoribacter multivorans]|uniref:Glycosyltransferase n=1 Tax=Flaviramulus multivorans TaxID=1304750 RepID=A0ABS9IFR4_9FLAO|nr:glycosyltransferase [Flaviramulus multivorans]MCF7559602.1 glycosyltransferase [Flaviramulus multivorans]
MKKEYIILQTVAPDYRSKLYYYIKQEFGEAFAVYAGLEYFETTVKTDQSISGFKQIKNHFLFNRTFLIQTGMWKDVIKCKILVMEMNPRIISNWITLIVRKFLNKKTILWGHAWPRSGSQSKTDKLRKIMRGLGDSIIVYTKSQKEELVAAEPHLKVNFAPNALYFKNEMVVGNQNPKEINHLIYVGRLTPLKKPKLLLQAFHKALPNLEDNIKLVFVGDGEERPDLEAYVEKHNLEGKVILTGHISDYSKLAEFYSKALFSVSPGYIGLSVTQSFGFGVPMLVSKTENHSPEIEAVIKNENALFFETDNLESLKNKILGIYQNKQSWMQKREDISNYCKEKYSINAMGNTFIKLFREQ